MTKKVDTYPFVLTNDEEQLSYMDLTEDHDSEEDIILQPPSLGTCQVGENQDVSLPQEESDTDDQRSPTLLFMSPLTPDAPQEVHAPEQMEESMEITSFGHAEPLQEEVQVACIQDPVSNENVSVSPIATVPAPEVPIPEEKAKKKRKRKDTGSDPNNEDNPKKPKKAKNADSNPDNKDKARKPRKPKNPKKLKDIGSSPNNEDKVKKTKKTKEAMVEQPVLNAQGENETSVASKKTHNKMKHDVERLSSLAINPLNALDAVVYYGDNIEEIVGLMDNLKLEPNVAYDVYFKSLLSALYKMYEAGNILCATIAIGILSLEMKSPLSSHNKQVEEGQNISLSPITKIILNVLGIGQPSAVHASRLKKAGTRVSKTENLSHISLSVKVILYFILESPKFLEYQPKRKISGEIDLSSSTYEAEVGKFGDTMLATAREFMNKWIATHQGASASIKTEIPENKMDIGVEANATHVQGEVQGDVQEDVQDDNREEEVLFLKTIENLEDHEFNVVKKETTSTGMEEVSREFYQSEEEEEEDFENLDAFMMFAKTSFDLCDDNATNFSNDLAKQNITCIDGLPSGITSRPDLTGLSEREKLPCGNGSVLLFPTSVCNIRDTLQVLPLFMVFLFATQCNIKYATYDSVYFYSEVYYTVIDTIDFIDPKENISVWDFLLTPDWMEMSDEQVIAIFHILASSFLLQRGTRNLRHMYIRRNGREQPFDTIYVFRFGEANNTGISLEYKRIAEDLETQPLTGIDGKQEEVHNTEDITKEDKRVAEGPETQLLTGIEGKQEEVHNTEDMSNEREITLEELQDFVGINNLDAANETAENLLGFDMLFDQSYVPRAVRTMDDPKVHKRMKKLFRRKGLLKKFESLLMSCQDVLGIDPESADQMTEEFYEFSESNSILLATNMVILYESLEYEEKEMNHVEEQ